MTDQPAYDHYVFISLDTLRSDGIAANPVKLWPDKYRVTSTLRTPLLDKMVADGAFFPNTISAAPYTSASHATLLTGKWPPRHGVYEFFNRRLRAETVFTWARRLGMRTYLKSDFPIILGEHLGFTDDVDDYIVEDDAEYLRRLDLGGPTFSLIHFGSLHIPYGFHNLRYGGDAYRRRVAELEAEVGAGESALGDRLVETYRSGEDLDLLLRYKQIVFRHYQNGDYDTLFSLYIEGISTFMRSRFEPFMERLMDRFDGRRTLFVIFGDHGEEYDAANYGHFNSLAEGVIRIPLLFYGPDIVPGTHLERVRSVDLAATVSAFLGEAPDGLDGASLRDAVLGGARVPARPAFSQAYVSDTAAFVGFQRRLLESGRKTGSLPHVRFAEAVYDGDLKLRRQNYEYTVDDWSLAPCEPRIALDRFDGALVPRPADDAAEAARLIAMLDEYGAMAPAETSAGHAAGDPEVTDEIRAQLRNMGYDI